MQAYYEARRHKRNTVNQLEFECNLDENLVELAHELENRTYELSPSVCFISTKPVKRAARFIKSESDNFNRSCYVLRLDISGFFMSIDRDILYRLCIEGLRQAKWQGVPNKDLCVTLKKIVDSRLGT